MGQEILSSAVKDTLHKASQEVGAALPQKSDLESKRRILKQYVAAIEGNFVSWMGTAAICARSIQGRYAASENLWVEMRDDHAGMLRTFAKSAGCEPSTEDYQAVEDAVLNIRHLVSRLSGLECLTLMATLEHTSAAFIPWLESIAKELGSDNLKYTVIHGEADIAHADQFAWAVSHEMTLHDNGEAIVKETIDKTVEFLKAIFDNTSV